MCIDKRDIEEPKVYRQPVVSSTLMYSVGCSLLISQVNCIHEVIVTINNGRYFELFAVLIAKDATCNHGIGARAAGLAALAQCLLIGIMYSCHKSTCCLSTAHREHPAWAPQIKRLWTRIGKDCKREHPRAPSVRRLWKEDATEAVIEFLENTPAGSRSSGMARAKMDDRESVGQASEGESGGPGPS